MIKATVARYPIAVKQAAITNTTYQDVADVALYRHVAADFDPAPAVTFRTTGIEKTQNPIIQSLRVQLIGVDPVIGTAAPVANSDHIHSPASSITTALSLTDAWTYHAQVKVDAVTETGELWSADLVFAQTTTDPAGLKKIVAFYPSVTAGADIATNATNLNFLFNSPANSIPNPIAAQWQSSIKRLTGLGKVSSTLVDSAGTALATGSSLSGAWDIGVASVDVTQLPSTPTTLDTQTVADAGSSGRLSVSILREVLSLRDVSAPAIGNFQASPLEFSPNGDGVQDSSAISAQLCDYSLISWTITIKSAAGATVTSGSGSGQAAWSALGVCTTPVVASWTWAGKDDSGAVVPDGTYTAVLAAADDSGNVSPAQQFTLTVDTSRPTRLPFEAAPNPFSPDSASPRNSTTISAVLSDSVPWSISITDASGVSVRSFSGTGPTVTLAWDGRDASGNRVANGPYKVSLTATDAAGNNTNDSLWVTVGPAPVISSVSPTPAQIGGEITITGLNFGQGVGVRGVTLQGRSAFATTWSPTQVTAFLPSGLQPGPADVRVWASDLSSLEVNIQVANYVVPADGQPIATGYISVRLKSGADPVAVAGRQGDQPTAIFRQVPTATDPVVARWYRVLTAVGSERSQARAYASDPDVEFAEVRGIVGLDALPNDLDARQWGLSQPSGIDVGAPRAWDFSTGSPTIVIAIVDSGIGPHPDISINRLPGTSYDGDSSDFDACASSSASISHGTRVAGIASSDTNNGVGIAGTGWQSKVRSYRIFREIPGDTACYGTVSIDLPNVLNDVARNGDRVVNMSWFNTEHSEADQDAIDAAWNAGVVLVASAGNTGSPSPQFPASAEHVIAVGAYDRDGNRPCWSNYGDWVDVSAPGAGIYTTRVIGAQTTYDDGFSGTSASAPFVSGAAALVLARGSTNAEATDALTNTATRVVVPTSSSGVFSPAHCPRGSFLGPQPIGRLNAAAAAQLATPVLHPNGTWIKQLSDTQPQVYFLDGGLRRPVPSSQVLGSWGVAMSDVVRVPTARLERYPLGSAIGFRPGSLVSVVSSGSDQLQSDPLNTFIVTNNGTGSSDSRWTTGEKLNLAPLLFACLAYPAARVRIASEAEASLNPTSGSWTDCAHHPNGSVLKFTTPPTDRRVWILEGGLPRLGKDDSIRGSWSLADDAGIGPTVDSELRDLLFQFPDVTPVGYRPGVVLRLQGPDERWAIAPDGQDFAAGVRRRFVPFEAFDCYAYPSQVLPEQRDYVSQLHPQIGGDVAC